MGRLEINQRIGILRARKNLSGKEFAERLGVKRSTVNNWETGGYNVKADDIENICRTFHVSSDWLLGILPENNYTDDEKIKLASTTTGLSNEAIKQICKLDRNDKQILCELIEANITGILDSIDTATMINKSYKNGKAETFSTDLLFDEKNTPYIKLSPEDTITFFIKRACDLAADVIKIVVNERKIKETERKIKENRRGEK